MVHKYKPPTEWDIAGFLCSDCHIEKTKEFVLKKQEEKAKYENAPDKCAICETDLIDDIDKKNKPRWQWNLDAGSLLCKGCYDKREADYLQELNFCASCNQKLGFVRYHPKPTWGIKGQMCRECCDKQNTTMKGRI